jgi:hypothetical protein
VNRCTSEESVATASLDVAQTRTFMTLALTDRMAGAILDGALFVDGDKKDA